MSLRKKSIKAVKWTSVTTLLSQFFVFIFSIYKYRLLEIEVFGTMAIAGSIITIMRMIQTLGFGASLVQNKKINTDYVNSVFTLIVLVSIILLLFIIAISGFISRFYDIKILKSLLIILMALFVFNSVNIVQKYLLVRKMEFKIIRLIELASLVLSGLLTITLAYNGYKIWSLVYSQIFRSVFMFFAFLKYTKWKPLFKFKWKVLKPSLDYSLGITYYKIISVVKLTLPELILGRAMGPEILGLYTFAKNVIFKIVKQADALIVEVLFPMFAKLQNNFPRLIKAYLKVNHYTFLITIPIIIGYIYIAELFISVIYGEKWLDAVLLSQILLLGTLINSIISKGTSVFLAIGRSDISTNIELMIFFPLIVALIVSTKIGLISFILVLVSFTLVELIIQYIFLYSTLKLNFLKFLNTMKTPLQGSTVMVFMIFILKDSILLNFSSLMSLLTIIIIGGLTYAVTIYFLEKKELIPIMKSILQSK